MQPMKLGRFQKFVHLDSFVNYKASCDTEASPAKYKLRTIQDGQTNGYAFNKKSIGQTLYAHPELKQFCSVPKLKPLNRINSDDKLSIFQVPKQQEPPLLTNSSVREKYKSIDISKLKDNGKTPESLDTYLNFLKVNGTKSVRQHKDVQDELKIIVNRFRKDNHHRKVDEKKKKSNIDDEDVVLSTMRSQKRESFQYPSEFNIVSELDNIFEHEHEIRLKKQIQHTDHSASSHTIELGKLRLLYRTAADQWQQAYARKYKQQISDLKHCIQQFVHQIDCLVHNWKNNNRVRKYVESLVMKFQELKKLLIPPDGVMNILLNSHQMEKFFQYKEMVHIIENVVQVTKFNFTHTHELQIIYQNLQEVNKNCQIQEISALQQQLFKDLKSVKKVEDKLVLKKQMLDLYKDPNKILGIDLFRESELSYFSPLMHNQNKNLMLQKIEKVYGILPQLKSETREVNDVLDLLLNNLISSKEN